MCVCVCVSAYVVGKKLENYLLLLALARRRDETVKKEGKSIFYSFTPAYAEFRRGRFFFAKKLKCNTLLNAHTVACSVRVRVLM